MNEKGDLMDIKQFPSDLKRLADQMGENTDALMRDLGYYFLHNTFKKWEIRGAGGEYQGMSWPALAPSTVALKGPNSTMLIDTGSMHGALNMESDDTTATIFFSPPEDQKYKYHHEGTSKMPARVLLEISAEDEVEMERIVDLWSVEHLLRW